MYRYDTKKSETDSWEYSEQMHEIHKLTLPYNVVPGEVQEKTGTYTRMAAIVPKGSNKKFPPEWFNLEMLKRIKHKIEVTKGTKLKRLAMTCPGNLF